LLIKHQACIVLLIIPCAQGHAHELTPDGFKFYLNESSRLFRCDRSDIGFLSGKFCASSFGKGSWLWGFDLEFQEGPWTRGCFAEMAQALKRKNPGTPGKDARIGIAGAPYPTKLGTDGRKLSPYLIPNKARY
jgi:hypothetical protein